MSGVLERPFDNAYLAALLLYEQRSYKPCADVCADLLKKDASDSAAIALKLHSETQQVYVDETEVDKEAVADALFDESHIANPGTARPGTTMRKPRTAAIDNKPNTSIGRPRTKTGRPVSGMVRPETSSQRPGTVRDAITAGRRSRAGTSRPLTSAFLRGRTGLITSSGRGFNLARLNYSKYAGQPGLAKLIFEYMFYHEEEIQQALTFANLAFVAVNVDDYAVATTDRDRLRTATGRVPAQQIQRDKDKSEWYWYRAQAYCYYRLGMFREAESLLDSAILMHPAPELYLMKGKLFKRLDQPLRAIDIYKEAASRFPHETFFDIAVGRVYEEMADMRASGSVYMGVLKRDPLCIEALSCVAANCFYEDAVEFALRYYRRILQLGVVNAEIYNNIALCCFYSQQFDILVPSFMRALQMAENDEVLADIWYNIGNMLVALGEVNYARACFELSLTLDADNTEAANNLACLHALSDEWNVALGLFEQAQALLRRAQTDENEAAVEANIPAELAYNLALASEHCGDYGKSFRQAQLAFDNGEASGLPMSEAEDIVRHARCLLRM